MTTYAPQDGGTPDTNAPDLGYHYPINEDSDHDGLPDWWEWKYFGNFNQTRNGDFDGDDVSNYEEFLAGTDSNTIAFTIGSTNDYVNHTNVAVQLKVDGGVPSYYAIFVNRSTVTNWLPYVSSNLTVNLGTTDATYNVVVGLRGLPTNAQQTWRDYAFYLDRQPLVLSITNPMLVNASATVIKPYLQLKGLAGEPVSSLSYDITNAFGFLTNQDVIVSDQTFKVSTIIITNSAGTFTNESFDGFSTNYFHANDVALATGCILTLSLISWAGGTPALLCRRRRRQRRTARPACPGEGEILWFTQG